MQIFQKARYLVDSLLSMLTTTENTLWSWTELIEIIVEGAAPKAESEEVQNSFRVLSVGLGE